MFDQCSYTPEPTMGVKPIYKKLPVIPAIILFLLIGAWVFRWDYTTTQNIGKLKIVHKTDRWTGNHWAVVYGLSGSAVISGKEIPCLKNGQIAVGKQVDDVRHKRDFATRTWWIAFIAAFIYLICKLYGKHINYINSEW